MQGNIRDKSKFKQSLTCILICKLAFDWMRTKERKKAEKKISFKKEERRKKIGIGSSVR